MSTTEHVVAVFDWRFLKEMTARPAPGSRVGGGISARGDSHAPEHGGHNGGFGS